MSRSTHPNWFSPWAIWPALLVLASLPLVYYGTAVVDCKTSGLTVWLPDSDGERDKYHHFVDLFGGDDLLVVSWPDCTLDDPRVEQVATAVAQADRRHAGGPLIRRLLTGPRVVERLVREPTGLSRAEAVRRLQGVLIGPDAATTCLLLEPTDAGKAQQQTLVALVRQAARHSAEIAPETLRLGGSVFEAAVIDHESERTLHRHTLVVAVITLLLAWWCFRSVWLVVVALFAAGWARYASMDFIFAWHGPLNAVLILTPILVYVLTVSGSVHLVNYYGDAVRHGGARGASLRALRAGWWPCTLATFTTAVGLVSLAISHMEPIRQFGVYSAVCLIAALAVMLTFIPCALAAWPPRTVPATGSTAPDARRRRVEGVTTALVGWVIRRHGWVSLVLLLAVVLAAGGLVRTRTSVKIERMFPPESEILQNYAWIEERLGPLIPVEVLLRFPDDSQLTMLDRLECVQAVQRAVAETPQVGGIVSPATFVGALPEAGGARGVARRRIAARRIERQQDVLVAERMLAYRDGFQWWRISARVPAIHPIDYSHFAETIRWRTGQAVAQLPADRRESLEVVHTGLLPTIQKAQHQLLRDLVMSLGLAVLIICPMMMLVLRGAVAGLLAMIPNLLPIAVVFGVMGWLGYVVDVGSVLTASVALGIAVDDTLHFLTWFARGVRGGMTRRAAIVHGFRRCAVAMLQTTVICGLGLLVLVRSEFIPTQRFAWLIFTLLSAALVGDLLLLPAMLAGPLGRVFMPAAERREPSKRPVATDPLNSPA